MRNDFCIFICSNGRAGSVTTIKALEGSGYTGDWYILCDDLDRQLDDYRESRFHADCKDIGEQRRKLWHKYQLQPLLLHGACIRKDFRRCMGQ